MLQDPKGKANGRMTHVGVILAAVVVFGLGCSDNPTKPNDEHVTGPKGEIGPGGGVLEVTDPDSPIYGVKVEVPPQAVAEPTEMQIVQCACVPELANQPGAELWSVTVSLEPKGMEFDERVSVTLPYSSHSPVDLSSLFVFRTDDFGESLCLVTTEIDSASRRITALTMRSSSFSVWKLASGQIWRECDTPFEITKDVLSVSNAGLGACAGMCNLAQWYFINKKDEYGDLLGRRSPDGERELALNAQLGVYPMRLLSYPPGDDLGYRLARAAQLQLMDGNPTVLGVGIDDGDVQGHAIIADQVNLSEPGYIIFKAYDPNYPKVLRPARYDLAAGTFTYVIDERLGPEPVIGISAEPYKPRQMNTVLHAGAWEFTYTISDFYFPPPLMPPPLMEWASPCTLDIKPEISDMAVEVRMPPPPVPIIDAWMRGHILGENLVLDGVVTFWYVYIDPIDGSIQMGFGDGVLEYMTATFENDLVCSGVFKTSGEAPELGIQAWYSGTFTGRRTKVVPAGIVSVQTSCPTVPGPIPGLPALEQLQASTAYAQRE